MYPTQRINQAEEQPIDIPLTALTRTGDKPCWRLLIKICCIDWVKHRSSNGSLSYTEHRLLETDDRELPIASL